MSQARGDLTRPRAERAEVPRCRGAEALRRLRSLVESDEPLPPVTAQRMRGWAQLGMVQLEQGAPAEAAVSLWRAVQAFEQQETVAIPAQGRAQLAIQRRALSAPCHAARLNGTTPF